MEIIDHISRIPALGNSDIHIWGAEVSKCRGNLEQLKRVLSVEELEKAMRFHKEADQESSILARGALRTLLAAYSGEKAAELIFHYSENGKPFVKGSDLAFNISHSGDWVVLAFGRQRQIGVDLEKVRRELDVMKIASRYFTEEEITEIKNADDLHAVFFHFWSRKEAYVKATGSALFRELSSFAVPYDDGEKEGWFFQRLEAGSGYSAAVATDQPVAAMPCFDFQALEISA